MGYGLVLIVLLMFFHGIRELYLLHVWNRPRYPDEDEPENEPDPVNNGTRKIHSNGFVYYSPIENETENDVFEWTVNRFRVEGNELEKDEDFGKNNS